MTDVAEPEIEVPRSSGPHRIEVERDLHGEVEAVRFVCDGDASSLCHSFPDCGCEEWTYELHGVRAGRSFWNPAIGRDEVAESDVPPAPGHEDVTHEADCWVDPWFNAALGDVLDWVEAYAGNVPLVPHPDGGVYDDRSWLVSGPIDTTWEGDYMTWEYADA